MTRATAIRKINVYDSSAFPTWRSSMSAWAWKEITGTGLSSVEFSPTPPGAFSGKLDAWNSLTVRKADSRLIRWGGGHGDYAGNEVDSIALNVDSPAWEQNCTPTPNGDIVADASWWGTAPNKKPNVGHNYQSVQFIDGLDKLFSFGRRFTYSSATDSGGKELIAFDWPTKKWDQPGTYSDLSVAPANVCQDSSGNVFALDRASDVMKKWTQSTKAWSTVGTISNHTNDFGAICYDTNRDVVLRIGKYTGGSAPWTMDVSTGANAGKTLTGDSGLLSAIEDVAATYYPGIVFDATGDRYLLHLGTTGAVAAINADTFACTALSTTGGGSIPDAVNGVNNRFVRVPNMGGIAYLPRYTSNVWFLATE